MAVTVVQHFDDALRRTPYDAFVERIRSRLTLTGFLMTPDAAFGFERRGTPVTLAALGRAGRVRRGRRAAVHARWARGPQLRDPRRRSPRATSTARHGCSDGRSRSRARSAMPVDGGTRLDFRLPVALPPDGDYAVRVDGAPRALRIRRRRRLPVRAAPRRSRHGRARSRPDPSSLSRRRGSRAPRPGSSHRRQPGRRGRCASQAGSPVLWCRSRPASRRSCRERRGSAAGFGVVGRSVIR